MLVKQQIIIGFYRQGKSKKKLADELGISRNTVRKYIEEYECEKRTSGCSAEIDLRSKGIVRPPVYKVSNRTKRRLTDEICLLIDGFLEQNRIKQTQGKSKQQKLGTDIHQALLDKQYAISYRTVCRYIKQAKQRSSEVYIRQHYTPGQAVEFDWGEVKLEIGGVIKRLMLAVFTSCFSNHRWARLYYRQDMSSFLHCHACYFSHVGGIIGQVVYDNTRTAVRKFAIRNVDKEPTEDLLKLSTYYQFDYRFCNARRGNEKGHVERSVEYIRRKSFCSKDVFDELNHANDHLLKTCVVLNQKPIKGKPQSINYYFEQELKHMRSAPAIYDTAEARKLRVDKYSCIRIDTNSYSVPEGHVGGFLDAKIYPDSIKVYDSSNLLIANHIRRHTCHKYYVKLDHYLKTLLKKPGALAGSLTLHQADLEIKAIFKKHFKHNVRDLVELLIFLKDQCYTINQLQSAVDLSIEMCPQHSVSTEKIKFLLLQNKQEKDQQLDSSNAKSQMSTAITNTAKTNFKLYNLYSHPINSHLI